VSRVFTDIWWIPFRVVRFWNHEILTNTEGVMESIRQQCLAAPLPRLERLGV